MTAAYPLASTAKHLATTRATMSAPPPFDPAPLGRVTTERLLGDSVDGVRLDVELNLTPDGYRVARIDRSNTCRPNRGHHDYRSDLCA